MGFWGETAGGTTRNTQIQGSRMSDLSLHAGFEVCLCSPLDFLNSSSPLVSKRINADTPCCCSNRPDVQSQHPGAGPMMAGGGGPPPPGVPPPQGGPPQGIGPPPAQGGMQYK